MPRGGLGGGFDLGSALSDYENIINFMETMKQRRLKEQNPLAASLGQISQVQDILGTQNLADQPELVQQLERLHQIPQGQLSQYAKGTKSRVQQKRIQDFQQHLQNVLEDISATKNSNLAKIGMLKGIKGVDPDFIKQMVETDMQGEQRAMQAALRSIQLGFSDVMDMPEVQNIIRQLQVESVMPQSPFGATSQGPGQIGQGVPPQAGMPRQPLQAQPPRTRAGSPPPNRPPGGLEDALGR